MFEFAMFEFLIVGDQRENGLKHLPIYDTIPARLRCEDLGAVVSIVHDLRLAGKST